MGDRFREQHGKSKRERQTCVSNLLAGVDDMHIDDSLENDVHFGNAFENVSFI